MRQRTAAATITDPERSLCASGTGAGGSRTDAALVSECLAGDEDSFSELMERYSRAVFAAALRVSGNRQDAEDLTQEVFLKAFRALHTYDDRRPFFPWIHRIALNASYDLRRRRGVEVSLDGVSSERIEAAARAFEPSLEEKLATEQEAERARAILEELSGPERRVLHLHYFAGISSGRLTKVLRLSVSGVKSRLHRARQTLRNQLLESNDASLLGFSLPVAPVSRPGRSVRRPTRM